MQKQSRQNDATWNFVRLVVSQLIPCIAEWCGLCAEMIWQPISYGGPLRSISSPISLIFDHAAEKRSHAKQMRPSALWKSKNQKVVP